MPDGVAVIHPDDATLLAELRGDNGVAAACAMQRHSRTLWRIARGILGMMVKPKRRCGIPGFAPSPARMGIAATRAEPVGRTDLLSGREVRRQPDKLNHLPAHSSKFDVSTYFPTTE